MSKPSEYTKLFDITAERGVIGACLMDPYALTKIAATLVPADFHQEDYQAAYASMLALADRQTPIDFVTLLDELQRAGKQVNVADLQAIAFDVPSALYVEHYAKIVAERATMRRLLAAAQEIAKTAFADGITAADALDKAEQSLLAISQAKRAGSMEHIAGPLKRMVDNLDAPSQDGISTGYTMLDRVLGGLQRSDLVILAARPGMGKSSLALGIADNASRRGANVVIFSLEMSKDQFVQRLTSMRSGIDSHRIRMKNLHDDEWPIILETVNELTNQPIHIDDTAAQSVDAIRREARRLHMINPLDLVVVDYMQLMAGKGDNREQEIANISRNLKAMAKELNVPVLALSQLNRGVESRADKRPMLSDLRESGSIEQDADAVLFIYREDYYQEDTDRQNIADVIIAKHRHGGTGTVSLFFRKELTLFRDLELKRTDLDY